MKMFSANPKVKISKDKHDVLNFKQRGYIVFPWLIPPLYFTMLEMLDYFTFSDKTELLPYLNSFVSFSPKNIEYKMKGNVLKLY